MQKTDRSELFACETLDARSKASTVMWLIRQQHYNQTVKKHDRTPLLEMLHEFEMPHNDLKINSLSEL